MPATRPTTGVSTGRTTVAVKEAAGTLDQELERAVSTVGIPSCPAVLVDLAAEVKKADPNLSRVEKLVVTDVALSASLLKTVNSPFYGLRNKATTVRHAITLLGLANLSRLISGLLLRQMLGPRGGVTMERFWDASAKGAAMTSRISHNLYSTGRDEAYTYGLFENVGIPILMARFPAYKDTLGRANEDSSQAFTAVEEQAHGVNHAVIGSMLAHTWFLPDFLTQAIRHHHDYAVLANPPAGLSVQSRNLIAMGLLADHAVREHSKVGVSAEWAKGGALVTEYVGLSAEQLEELMEDLRVALDEL